MPCYAIENLVPDVDVQAYVHPSAVLLGGVVASRHCYVGPDAALVGSFFNAVATFRILA